MNYIILKVMMIGKNSLAGAGSIVSNDIPCRVIVAGNPARVI
jgi:acetyltransferase-like isoleucine patch superfamily enzyme